MTAGQPRPERLFTPPFVAIAIVNGLTSLAFLVLLTSAVAYAVTSFQAGEAVAGAAAGVFVLGALLARLAAGATIDVLGRKRVLIAALALMAVCAALFVVIDALWLYIVVRAVMGIGFGLATTATNATAQELIPPARRGEGTGWYSLTVSVSQAIGPFLGVTLHPVFGFDALHWLAAALAVGGGVLALAVPIPRRSFTAAERRERLVPRARNLVESRALPMGVLAIITSIAFAAVMTFLGSFAPSLEGPPLAGAFFLVYAGVLLVSRPVGGMLLDRFADSLIVVPCLVLTLGAFVVLVLAPNSWWLLPAAALLALGYGTLVSASMAIAVRQSPRSRTSLAISTYYIGLDVGVGLGPTLLGGLADAFGYRGMFLVTGLTASVLGLAWYWWRHGRFGRRGPAMPADGPESPGGAAA